MRISVVMPVLNRRAHLERAWHSVRAQDIADIEMIAVDGGSTDGTREALAAMDDVRLIDAPGSSIYEALNLGIRATTGELIGHLNSDDEYAPNALRMVMDQAKRQSEVDIYRGLACYIALEPDGSERSLSRIDREVPPVLDLRAVLFGIPAINACLIRRTAYGKFGFYDERYRISSDREWLGRALMAGARLTAVNMVLYKYVVHPGSLTMATHHPSERLYALEHLRMAAEWLDKEPGGKAAAMLRSWHAHEMVRYLLREPALRARLREALQAFRRSPAWPLRSIGPILTVALRRLS